MFGKNPKRGIVTGDGSNLEVQSMFKTLQGEGPYVGHPSVFIRLGGCNLACHFCDTEFESFSTKSINEILSQVKEFSYNASGKKVINLIVITGGEPFRQPIELLCQKLIELNYLVQIETNGTLFREINEEVKIICSPKNVNGYKEIRDDLLKRINAFKFIVAANDSLYNQVAEIGQSKYNIPVYIQAMDEIDLEKNKQNINYALNMALENGYFLSIQTHKILDIE